MYHCFPLLRCVYLLSDNVYLLSDNVYLVSDNVYLLSDNVYLLSDNVFMQCQQMALEVNGSESPNGHSRVKKEYYELDRYGCVVADDLGPVDLSKWRSYCQQ